MNSEVRWFAVALVTSKPLRDLGRRRSVRSETIFTWNISRTRGDGKIRWVCFGGGVNVTVYVWDLFSNKEKKKQSCQHVSDLGAVAMNLNIELEQEPAHSCRHDDLIT